MIPITTVLETCPISPPPETAAELSVPLSFFDIIWLNSHPVRRLLFYNYPCSQHHFREIIVPKLKQSLSLTLQHYLLVAANFLYPLDTENKKPFLRYVAGDSVSLTIAESNNDFDELIGNHARDADQFYDFVAKFPKVTEESEFKIVPLMALQLTHFPNRGICVGFSNHHTLGDANSITRFISAWASISKSGGDEEFQISKFKSLPIFDRSLIQDVNGTDSKYWKLCKAFQIQLDESSLSSFPVPTNRVRATFILRRTDIENLKDLVLAKRSLAYVSSFVVTVSYVWTCLLKSLGETEEEQPEILVIPADVRGRLNARIDPPIPANYFGNCLGTVLSIIEHKKLVGEDGFVIAAETIAEEIKNKVNNKDEFLKDDLISQMGKLIGSRSIGISGSPKFDLLAADFGWGKARKLEVVSIDGDGYAMTLCKSRDFEGGLEIGLSLPVDKMKVFAAIFADGLMP